MSLPIIFDGLDLNDGETYVISNFAQSVGTRETDLITIPGRDGAVVGQNTMQPTVFTFDIVILGATVEERDQNLRNLFGTPIGAIVMTACILLLLSPLYMPLIKKARGKKA